MPDCMAFPNDWREFLKDYSFKDEDEVYTNGSQLIPTFRVEQLIEHLIKETARLRHCDCTCAPTIGGWISVKDRLPDKEGQYLCYVLVNKVEWQCQMHLWKDNRWYWVHDVHYWMPLPEPPNGGD